MASPWRMLRGAFQCVGLWLEIPWKQLINAVYGMLGDPGKHLAQISHGLHAVERSAAEQAIDGRRTMAARIRSGEQEVLAAQGNDAQGAFGGIVIDLDAPVINVAGERRPTPQRIADGPSQRRLAREESQ